MRVTAVISDLTYPPQGGLHQQSLLLIIELMKHFDVDLYCFCRSEDLLDLERLAVDHGVHLAGPAVVDRLPSVMRGLICCLPRFMQPAAIRRIIDGISTNHGGAIYLEGAAAAGLVRNKSARATIINIVDPPSCRQKRFAAIEKNGPLMTMLRTIAYWLATLLEISINYPEVVWNVVSPSDRDYLVRRLGHNNVRAISVMIPREVIDIAEKPIRNTAAKYLHVIIYADLRQPYMRPGFIYAMQQLAENDAIRARDVKFSVLGRVQKDAEFLNACGTLDVVFYEFVDDYVDFLINADIIVLPDTFGTGIKNRAIQSMALGKAVLGTNVAFEGIPVIDGEHAFVLDDLGRLGDRLAELINNEKLRNRLGAGGRHFAFENYHPRSILERWLKEFEVITTRDVVPGNVSALK